MTTRGFASDNYSGIHPDVLQAIAAANHGHVTAYGDDPLTARAVDVFRDHFGGTADVYLAFNGTGANVVGLQALLSPWEYVICTETSHINVDECGAGERILGTKLQDVPTPDGKLTPDLVRGAYQGKDDVHHVQPKVVAITQSTELGTRYTPDEIAELADVAHSLDMFLHMDGARIANAAAGLGVDLQRITSDCGVDILSFGGTKNGLMGGEAVVVFRPELSGRVAFIRKQFMQLASKMRFVAAQFIALLADDLWRRNADHANTMAQRLRARVADIPGVRVVHPVQANAVFARLPADAIPVLQDAYPFYVWDEADHTVRWMCSWDTSEDDIDSFAGLVAETLPPAAT